MCRDGWCFARALQLLGDLLDACSHGEPPQRALCFRLAEALDASAAFDLRIETTGPRCASFAWPNGAGSPLLLAAVERLVRALRLPSGRSPLEGPPCCLSEAGIPTSWRASVAGLVLWDALRLNDLALLPVGASGNEISIVALVSRRLFTARDMHLLTTTQGPLASFHQCLVGVDSLSGSTEGDHPLTPREVQVLDLLAEGLLASTIAGRLRVSPRTVHKHLGNVYRKLGTHDRLQAVMYAQELGIVPSPRPPPES